LVFEPFAVGSNKGRFFLGSVTRIIASCRECNVELETWAVGSPRLCASCHEIPSVEEEHEADKTGPEAEPDDGFDSWLGRRRGGRWGWREPRKVGRQFSGLDEIVIPRESPDEDLQMVERFTGAGVLDVLGEYRHLDFQQLGEAWSSLEERGVHVPGRLWPRLRRLFDERVRVPEELERLEEATGVSLKDPEGVVEALTSACTDHELRWFPNVYPAVHRWLLHWAVQKRFDEGVWEAVEGEVKEVPESGAWDILGCRFSDARSIARQKRREEYAARGGRDEKGGEGSNRTFSGGFEFQSFVVDQLKSAGFEVREYSLLDHYGADQLIDTVDVRVVLACRYMLQPVGLEAVQSVVKAMRDYEAPNGIIVTPFRYTEAAVAHARDHGVFLWGLSNLVRVAQERAI
jgi:hypothetical protein